MRFGICVFKNDCGSVFPYALGGCFTHLLELSALFVLPCAY